MICPYICVCVRACAWCSRLWCSWSWWWWRGGLWCWLRSSWWWCWSTLLMIWKRRCGTYWGAQRWAACLWFWGSVRLSRKSGIFGVYLWFFSFNKFPKTNCPNTEARRSTMMSGLFVVVLRVRQSLRLHRTSGPRSFVLRQAFAWNPHSLGISPQGAHLDWG